MTEITRHSNPAHTQHAIRAWDGLGVFRSRVGPGSFPEHEHPEIQVSVRIGPAGPGHVHATPGTLSIVESMRPHGGDLPDRCEFILAYFHPERLSREMFDQTGRSSVQIKGCEGGSDPWIVSAFTELFTELRTLPESEHNPGFPTPSATREIMAEAMSLWVMTRLLHAHSDAPPTPRGHWARERPLTARQLRASIGMLTESAHGVSASMTEIADQLGISPTRFTRGFRAAMGQPPHRYMMLLRARRATDMLLNTTAPLARISEACGFSSQSHMTEQLHRLTGTTPARIRAAKL